MDQLDEALRVAGRLMFAKANETSAYQAGKLCGRFGPSLTNCHFRYFTTETLKDAWERGKADGENQKRAHSASEKQP